MNCSTLSIIIPAYNEEATMVQILEKIAEVEVMGLQKEIIIVDDHSHDNTPGLIKKYMNDSDGLNIRYYRQERNMCRCKYSIKIQISRVIP